MSAVMCCRVAAQTLVVSTREALATGMGQEPSTLHTDSALESAASLPGMVPRNLVYVSTYLFYLLRSVSSLDIVYKGTSTAA